MDPIYIVGAGFSGSVIARELAEAGFRSIVIDQRNHIAGNCWTERDSETGIMVHTYGPHIFHTDDESIWSYISKHGAVSNLKCNTPPLNFIIEHFLWRFEAETCARPRIEAEGYFFEVAA